MTLPSSLTIRTAKGSHTGSLCAICAWQAENQGAFAVVSWGDGDSDSVDVSAIDFDADDVVPAIREVRALIADLPSV